MRGKPDYRRPTVDCRPQGLWPVRDYTKVRAWQCADDLTVAVYQATGSFPREGRYGLTRQLRRAALPAIRGAGRPENAENLPHADCGQAATLVALV